MSDTPPEALEEGREAAPPGEPELPDEGGPSVARSGRGRSALLWGILVLFVGLAGIQAAGILLRDRLEGRMETGGKPLQLGPATPAGAPAAPGPGQRFGPDVHEVVVVTPPPAAPATASPPPSASPPTEAPKEPIAPEVSAPQAIPPPPAPAPEPVVPEPAAAETPPPQAPGQAEPAPNAASQEVPPPPAAAAPPLEPSVLPGAAAPRREGGYVLQMGVFRSQKYRRELEQRLEDLGEPYYRTEGTGSGSGFRLTIPTPDPETRARAAAVLASGGYAYRTTTDGLEVRFFLEEEAQAAMDRLGQAGFRVGYMRVEGETPLWTVLAGPYDLAEAKAARERFGREGLDSYLRKRP